MKSIFAEMGGTYTLGEDGMYYPDLELPVDEEPHYGKYGRMRKAYIKEHRPWLYTELLFDGKLVSHAGYSPRKSQSRSASSGSDAATVACGTI